MLKMNNKRILFVVNDDWFLLSHRLPIALKAKELGYEVHVATGSYDGDSKLEAYGFVHHVYPIARAKVNPLKDLAMITALYKLYKKITPDIVHHITIKPVIFGGIAAKLAKVKAVVSAISGLGVVFIEQGFKANVKRKLVGWLYHFALAQKNSLTIVQNDDDKKTIQKIANLPNEHMLLIKGSGVDLDKFPFTPTPNNSSCQVVLVARMLRDKGVNEFYQSAKIVKESFPDVTFILAGGTHENPASLTEEILSQWNAEGIVKWIGHQESSVSVLQSADIVVLPSYREGLPKVLLEAQAIGRPVITTDVPGCRDAIINNKTGILVKVKDIDSLVVAITSLITDKKKRESMGYNGRLLVEEQFSISLVVSQHMSAYSHLISCS